MQTMQAIEQPKTRKQPQMACGWCKGFIHEEWVSAMRRYVHDEKPTTNHEVLPYRVR